MTAGTYNKYRKTQLAAAVLEIKEPQLNSQRGRSGKWQGTGAAALPLPTLQAGEAQATPPIGIGIRVSGSSPALAALFLPIPALVAATQAILS